jgi:iron complex outermembrane recepter protein
MKHSILSLLLLAVSGITAFSQKVILQGKVVDQNARPVAYASVFVLKNGNLLSGKICSEDGRYKMLIDSAGTYTINVTHSDFAAYNKTVDLTAVPDSQVVIMQSLGKELSDVTVTAKWNPLRIERKIDRVVMNVEKNALATGRDALDLLTLAPGVFVNFDGTIFIGGVPGTRVMINGRLLNLSGADLTNYLRNLRSDGIKSVEVIARPGAEYDASGSGGLINIILKKSTKAGINGTLGMDYTQGLRGYPGLTPKGSINYNTGKWSFSGIMSYLYQKDFVNLTQDRGFFPNSGKYTSLTNTIRDQRTKNAQLSATYEIDKKQYIAIDYTGQFRNFKETNTSGTSIVYPDPANTVTSSGSFPMKYRSDLSTAGFNYHRETDTLGSKLTVLADYTYFNRNTLSNTNSQTFNAIGGLTNDTVFTFTNPSNTRIATFDARHEKNFKSGRQLSYGVRGSITDIVDDNRYAVFKNNIWSDNNTLGFNYSYKENILAGFANLSGRLAKIDYKIGLRAENSDIRGTLIGGGQDTITKNNYLSLFPDVFLKKNTNQYGSSFLLLSYNRRITRPSFSQLNPFRYYIDNFTIKAGNPLLVPQFTSTYSLAYLMKGKYYFELSYTSMKDMISQFVSASTQTGLAVITNGNVGKNEVYTATLSIPYQIAKGWSTNNVLLLTHTRSYAPGQFDIREPSFFLQTVHSISLPSKITMNVKAFYTPVIVQGNTVAKDVGTFDIGFMKKFMKDKLTVNASLNHLIIQDNVRGLVYLKDNLVNFGDEEQRTFSSLSLTYNFNAGKSFRSKAVKNSNENVKTRL